MKKITFAMLVVALLLITSMTVAFSPIHEINAPVAVDVGDEDAEGENGITLPDFDQMTVEQITAWVVGALYGVLQVFVPGLSIFDLFKRLFKLQDFWAHVLVIVLAVLVSIGAMYLAGVLELVEYSVQGILGFAFSLYAASQLAYRKLTDFKNDL